MRIFLIRHGESAKVGNDSVLTEKGIVQAKHLAKRLKNIQLGVIFTSDLTRAKQTFAEYQKFFPDVKYQATVKLNEIYRVLVGGPEKEGTPKERTTQDKKRADDFFNKLLKMKKQSVTIFAHGNIIRYFLAKALNIPPKELWKKLIISPGSISIIEKDRDLLSVKAVNIIEHQDIDEVINFYNGPITNENYLS